MEPGEPDGRGDGKKDASGVVFEELEERLWVPPTKKNRQSQNGEASRSNGDSNLNDDDDDHGKLLVIFCYYSFNEHFILRKINTQLFIYIFVLFHLAHKNLECINRLSDEDIDKFLIVARSVGTFARALDCSSSVKQPR